MSEKDKNNKDFQFIQEEVIEKKHRKIKKWLAPILMTMMMAVLFGLIAAATFIITEPKLYKLLGREEEQPRTPITFPTIIPEVDIEEVKEENNLPITPVEQQEPTIVEKHIDADIKDFTKMYDEIKKVSYQTSKSLVKVSGELEGTDWIGNPMKKYIDTTGVIISDLNHSFLILVSYDRIKDSKHIKVMFESRIEVEAVIHDYEEELNLALISISQDEIPEYYRNSIAVVNFSQSTALTVGTPIVALGNPNGYLDSVDVGVVTHRGNSVSITDNRLDIFYTNMETNKESDGIIINLNGDLVGIITRTLKADKDEALSAVLGISKLDRVIERMANQEPRIYFGVKAADMTPGIKSSYSVINGIFVSEVEMHSPALDAGIKTGDIILQVNENDISTTNGFNNTISEFKADTKIKIKVKRVSGTAEKEIELEVILKNKESK